MNRKLTVLFLATVIAASSLSADELRFQAVWSSGNGSNIVSGPLGRAAFIDRGEELTAQGLRLIDVETARVDGQRVYTGIWIGGSGSNLFAGPMTLASFRQERQQRRDQGLRLVDFEVFRSGSERRYLGVWRPGSGRERLTPPRSAQAFIQLGERLTQRGLRLIDVEVLRVNGQPRYLGLWREGTGSNLFTTPRRRSAFRQLRNQMRANGLELTDMERVVVDGRPRYVGVWRSGDGESRISIPRDFASFVAHGVAQTEAGRRTREMEVFRVPTPAGGGDNGGGNNGGGNGGGNPSAADLPDLPSWIQLSGNPFLIVDFGPSIDGHPRVTLPVDFLPDFLPVVDGEVVIPDNFCGFNVRRADAFFWQDQGNQVVTDFPYNNVEDVSALGSNDFLGGIDFTGPIGQCAEDNEPWQFFQPLTQTGGDSPIPNLKLVIQMRQDSEIEFLNFNFHPGEPLNAHELFSEEVFEQIKEIAELFESLEIDNGYCSIDNYVQKICEEEEEGEAPVGSCPVSDDFSSPC